MIQDNIIGIMYGPGPILALRYSRKDVPMNKNTPQITAGFEPVSTASDKYGSKTYPGFDEHPRENLSLSSTIVEFLSGDIS